METELKIGDKRRAGSITGTTSHYNEPADLEWVFDVYFGTEKKNCCVENVTDFVFVGPDDWPKQIWAISLVSTFRQSLLVLDEMTLVYAEPKPEPKD